MTFPSDRLYGVLAFEELSRMVGDARRLRCLGRVRASHIERANGYSLCWERGGTGAVNRRLITMHVPGNRYGLISEHS